ncbi:MAG: hypothetical protein JRD04_10455 [Deltaproteobacteria bacterium]|nr:hypothetical protein [Deltaproteobacteria bacterium]
MVDDVNTHWVDQNRRIAHIRMLNILAGLVWCLGGVILLVKGGTLLAGSASLFPGAVWPWIAAGAGLLLGAVKGKFIFSRSCKNNLTRISSLRHPKLWQFFSPGFFVLLSLMIAAGAVLSRLAHTSFAVLVGVAVLDLAIGAALLASSRVFWQQKAFVKSSA